MTMIIRVQEHGQEKTMAAQALENITHNKQHRNVVVSAGGVAALLGVLQDGLDQAKQYTAGTLALITDNKQHCDVVVMAGGVAALLGILQQGPEDAKEGAALALAHITDNKQHRIMVVHAQTGLLEVLQAAGAGRCKARCCRTWCIELNHAAAVSSIILSAGGILA